MSVEPPSPATYAACAAASERFRGGGSERQGSERLEEDSDSGGGEETFRAETRVAESAAAVEAEEPHVGAGADARGVEARGRGKVDGHVQRRAGRESPAAANDSRGRGGAGGRLDDDRRIPRERARAARRGQRRRRGHAGELGLRGPRAAGADGDDGAGGRVERAGAGVVQIGRRVARADDVGEREDPGVGRRRADVEDRAGRGVGGAVTQIERDAARACARRADRRSRGVFETLYHRRVQLVPRGFRGPAGPRNVVTSSPLAFVFEARGGTGRVDPALEFDEEPHDAADAVRAVDAEDARHLERDRAHDEGPALPREGPDGRDGAPRSGDLELEVRRDGRRRDLAGLRARREPAPDARRRERRRRLGEERDALAVAELEVRRRVRRRLRRKQTF